MRDFIKDKNTYILIVIVSMFSVYNFFIWNQISDVQKYVVIYAILAALHEVEEKIWPGGFCELMLKKLGANTQDPNVYMATLPVTIYWIVTLGVSYMLHTHAFLLVMLIALSFMETMVHTVGIKLHKMTKPYTPGLVTAWGMGIVAVFTLRYLISHRLVSAWGYVAGVLLMVVGFAIMGYFVYKPTGVNPMKMAKEIMSERKNKA